MARKTSGKGKDDGPRAPTLVNAKARREYEVVETLEAGLVLTGAEVKSLRAGNASLSESFARFRSGELWLMGMHVGEYAQGGYTTQEPTRPRKLLLHRKELIRLSQTVQRKGLTLVPMKLYWSARHQAKIELALARGRRLHDKREYDKAKDAKREMDRVRRG